MHASSLPGGPVAKTSATYESLWGVRAMIDLLLGEADTMRIEEPRVDGAEFYVERAGKRTQWQVKRQLIGQAWTLHALANEGVLKYFLDFLRAGHCCTFASITDAQEVRILAERAKGAVLGPEEFLKAFVSDKTWSGHFQKLLQYWNQPDPAEAYQFLQQIEVRSADEYTLTKGLCDILGVKFSSPSRTTLDCLRTLYQDSVHQILTADSIKAHLQTRGIEALDIQIEESVIRKLRAATETYIANQRLKLIRGQMISRTVAQEIVTRIKESKVPTDTVIIGTAGSGKSGCMLEITDSLVKRGIPVLAFRLDRMTPVQTTAALGAELGLSHSPALVFARALPKQKIVLILDQLDVVSTTSGRHPDFFDTVAALIEEVRGLRADTELHLILACRKFDYEHDARLRALLPKDQEPRTLGELSEQEVSVALTAEGGDARRLTRQQMQLLRLPQNLALFIESGLVRNDSPSFVSQKELFDEYWKEKRADLSEAWPAEASQWMPIIEAVVREMNNSQELSVPKARLDAFSPHFLNVMVSAGILTFDQRRYGFGHESFFDYCFARSFANGGRELADFLESDPQHLFRRAQTRQVLVYLRDDNRLRYARNVRALLESGKIRAHLKLLVLELLSTFTDPNDDEWKIILPYIESEFDCRSRNAVNPNKMATRAFELFRVSTNLFRVADRLGYIEKWLSSGKPWLEDSTVEYLRWHSLEHGDRIAELMGPFVGLSGEWNRRLRNMMQVHNFSKSRRYFELLLRILDDGLLDEPNESFGLGSAFWGQLHNLSETQPEWLAEFAAQWLDRQVKIVQQNRADNPPHGIDFHGDAGVHDLYESARKVPQVFLANVLPSVIRAVEATLYSDGNEFPRDAIWIFRTTGEVILLREGYLGACETAFEALGKPNPEKLRPFIELLRASKTHTANGLLLQAYIEGGRNFADEAIALLCEQPERLDAGYSGSPYWISKRLIEELSPHCSEETFETLSIALSEYTPDYERSDERASIRGGASFTLLSALAPMRRGEKVRTLLAEYQTRFGKPDCAPKGARSFNIVSPVPEETAKNFSDDEWLENIAQLRGVGRFQDWEHPEQGGEQEFAAMMQKIVKEQPERLARLALRFPDDLNPCYWMNLLYGLKDAAIPSSLKIEIVRKVFGLNDNASLLAAIDLLCGIRDQLLPPDAIAFLTRMATEHPDPSNESWRERYGAEPAHHRVDAILSAGLNSVRGRTADQIRNLLLTNREYLDVLFPAIEHLICDQNISVRACVVSTLFGIAAHDEQLAISLFAKLGETEEIFLGTQYAEEFIRRGLMAYMNVVRPYIVRMVRSTDRMVCQAGGRLAALARLTHPEENELAELALAGNSFVRLGIAEVAECNFTNPQCREWCERVLFSLFNDDDDAVRRKVAHCFWQLWQKPEVPLTEYAALLENFLKSEAFRTDPFMLIHALEDSRHKLPEVVLDVCETYIKRFENGTGMTRDQYRIGPLAFRAYQQLAGEPAQLRALGLIDQMCVEGFHIAAQNLSEFDR